MSGLANIFMRSLLVNANESRFFLQKIKSWFTDFQTIEQNASLNAIEDV